MRRQPSPPKALIGIFVIFCITVTIAGIARAQAAPSSTESEEEKLERDFTDPLSTLPQVVIRDSYTPANYGPCTPQLGFRDVETNQLLIRPLIPRIPPRTFLPFVQLIRPALALVTVPSSSGGTRTEFGDLPVFDIAALPWPDRKKSGLLIGIGPTFVFPTATSKSAGQGAWQAGPALGAIYTGIPGLLAGFIAQNPVSIAYTSRHRPPLNTFRVPTRFRTPPVGEMVPAIRGGRLDHGLASPFADHAAVEPRTRPDVCTPRAAPDELLCDGAMDALPAIRADRTSDHRKFRHDDGVPAIHRFLWSLEVVKPMEVCLLRRDDSGVPS